MSLRNQQQLDDVQPTVAIILALGSFDDGRRPEPVSAKKCMHAPKEARQCKSVYHHRPLP